MNGNLLHSTKFLHSLGLLGDYIFGFMCATVMMDSINPWFSISNERDRKIRFLNEAAKNSMQLAELLN